MIKNPAFPGDPVYDMAFNLYAMEEEGLLPTHKGTLNNLCKILDENHISLEDEYSFYWACDEAGVDWDLTNEDFEYISNRKHI